MNTVSERRAVATGDIGAQGARSADDGADHGHLFGASGSGWFADALPAKSVAIVIGTRPEAIKMAEVVRLLGPAAFLIHTGQHYSDVLWTDVVRDIGLPPHDVALAVGGQPRCSQIGDAITAIGATVRAHGSLRALVVHGDTNATVAGALAANAEGIPLFHVEAGLRSRDRRMPEEHNRVLADHLADVCLAPTPTACANLVGEGISPHRIQLTGNTIVEAVHRLLPVAGERSRICRRYGVEPHGYVLATLHRPENSDNAFRLAMILDDLRALNVPVLLPLHPRTRQAAAGGALRGICVVDPVCPTDFLALLAESRLVVTDSGGVQEELTVLGRQGLVVRRSTERPESLASGATLAEPGVTLRRLALQKLEEHVSTADGLPVECAFGDGYASRRIVDAVARAMQSAGATER